MKDFADTLESYLIPTREGFFDKFAKKKLCESPDSYQRKVKFTLKQIQENAPEEIKREQVSRVKILKLIESTISNINSKIKSPLNLELTPKYLKNIISGDFNDCAFLTDLLPSSNPDDKAFAESTEWYYNSKYYVIIGEFEFDDEEEKFELQKIIKTLKTLLVQKLKSNSHFATVDDDIEDGHYWNIKILLKPSTKFIQCAKEYGYDIALENYLIPTQEGFFKNLFKKKTSAAPSSSTQKIDDRYWENTLNILDKIEDEHPEEIKKERESRIKFLKTLLRILDGIQKKYKNNPNMAGFTFKLNELKELSKYPNINKNSDLNTIFLLRLLPSAQFSKMEDWEWDEDYRMWFIEVDIYKWSDARFSREKLLQDPNIAEEFYDLLNKVVNDINTQCKGLPHFEEAVSEGDWDDASIEIRLKPSPQFIALASKYGYKY